MLRVIKIDVVNQVVTTIKMDKGLKALYKEIGCELVEKVTLANGIDMWLDEEGLLQNPQAPKFCFVGSSNVFTGNAIIAGYTANGEMADVPILDWQLKPMIQFLGSFHQEPEPPRIYSWSPES